MDDNQNPVMKTFAISDLVKMAESSQVGPDLYINHVVATVSENELVMDFYQLGPTREDTGKPVAIHRQRIVFPEKIIPGFLTMMISMNELFKSKNNQ